MDTSALVVTLHRSPRPCVLALTGGGAGAVAALLGVAGASRTILEALVPYHPDALADFLGFIPEQACSADTGRAIARRAFDRARRLAPSESVVGVGVTASLATDRPKKGDHRFHLTIHTRLQSTSLALTFRKGERDRAAEEAVLDAVLLNALAETFGVPQRLPELLLPGETVERETQLASDPLAKLLRGELAAVCHEADGRLHEGGPRPTALLSGSFNPLHAGHSRLAEVARRKLGREVAFEMTLRNADKPALPVEEAERRLRQFAWARPVWLTLAPTFAEKARLFPGATWVVGADTAERIVQERFYGGATGRDAALATLRELGCRFLVAGRCDAGGRFVGLESLEIPTAVRDLFEGIGEEEFRHDVSSTNLRGGGRS